MGRSWQIEPLLIPDSLDCPEAADFIAAAELANLVSGLIWGHNDHAVSAGARLAAAQPSRYEHTRTLVVRDGERIIGQATVEQPMTDNTDSAYVHVLVHPHYRRSGAGTALRRAVEEYAAGKQRHILMAWTEQPADSSPAGADVVRPRTGRGSLSARGAAAAFARSGGYELEQVERFSVLPLPVDAAEAAGHRNRAALAAGPAYQILTWHDRCPDHLIEQYAYLRARMILDIPSGALSFEEEVWDGARVREEERALGAKGGHRLVAAARNAAENRLVGHTIVEYYPEVPEVLYQEDTLVLTEHRGHRLGMLLKAHNLLELQQRWPEGRRLYTWNAEENEHMLSVNAALGFAAAGFTGAWQKKLGAQPHA